MSERPVVLQAHSDLPSFATCSDCKRSGDEPEWADYAILVEGSPDWDYVCEGHSYEYDWEDADIEIDLGDSSEFEGDPFEGA